MPVLDKSGRLAGIVTQTDLVERDKPLHIPTVISLFDWVFYLESEKSFRDEVKRISARKVGEICTREVVTCGPDTPVEQIATLMVDNKAHLVPVVDDENTVLGVVARLDIIRSMGV
jgi:CBS-domain-containing membrane protein